MGAGFGRLHSAFLGEWPGVATMTASMSFVVGVILIVVILVAVTLVALSIVSPVVFITLVSTMALVALRYPLTTFREAARVGTYPVIIFPTLWVCGVVVFPVPDV